MNVFNETLGNAILEMHYYRSEIQSRLASGEGVAPDTHAEFEAAIAQAIYEVRPHVLGGDVPELRKLWTDYGVERVIDFESRTTVSQKQGQDPHHGVPIDEEVREIQRVGLGSLLEVTRLLDRIAKELGLMPDTQAPGRSSGRLG